MLVFSEASVDGVDHWHIAIDRGPHIHLVVLAAAYNEVTFGRKGRHDLRIAVSVSFILATQYKAIIHTYAAVIRGHKQLLGIARQELEPSDLSPF